MMNTRRETSIQVQTVLFCNDTYSLLRVIDNLVIAAVNLQFPGLTLSEIHELGRIVKVVYLHLDPVKNVS